MLASWVRRLRSRLPTRPRARIEALFWLALVAFLGYRIWPQVAAAFGVASANAAAPTFQLTTLDGAAVSRDALRGTVVLVHFWATSCPLCRVEMPASQDVHDRATGCAGAAAAQHRIGAHHTARFFDESISMFACGGLPGRLIGTEERTQGVDDTPHRSFMRVGVALHREQDAVCGDCPEWDCGA